MFRFFVFSVLLTTISALTQPWSDHTFLISVTDEEGHHICTGVLISSRAVLTTAHCALSVDVDAPTTVNLQTHVPALSFSPRKIIVHPEFDSETEENDIAVLYSYQPFNIFALLLGSTVQSIDLAPVVSHSPLASFTVDESHSTVDIRNYKTVKESADCKTDRTYICVKSKTSEGDLDCDLSEPLIDLVSHKLVGITSCTLGEKGKFVKINAFKNWIEEVVKEQNNEWFNWNY